MTEHADVNDWLDKPFRRYIQSFFPRTLPRSGVLKDQFFEQTVQDTLNTTEEKLKKQTRFVRGMGQLGEDVLFQLIFDLRSSWLDAGKK